MKESLVWWVVSLVVAVVVTEIYNGSKKHPDVGLSIEQFIQRHGYGVEVHEVVTEDDYILTMHRIVNNEEKNFSKKVPILMMHGFSQSAIDFVTLDANRSLSFLLSKKNYDVWFGSVRGTIYSRKHKNLNPNCDREYWDFSFHEIGTYDLPAFIDHILKETQEKTLHYIGYSQGTITFFILGSEKPQYMKKIRLMTALAPAPFLKDPGGYFLNHLVFFRKTSEFLLDLFRFRSFLAEDSLISMYMKHICNENSLFVNLCMHHIFQLHGYDPDELNRTELSLVFANTPSGVSSKQTMHIVQLFESGDFHQYDLGTEENLKKYRQAQPPRYNLTKIDAPVALYYANNDHSINIKNIHRLVEVLPKVIKRYKVPWEKFNHYDFLNAKNVVGFLYKSVIEEIMKH